MEFSKKCEMVNINGKVFVRYNDDTEWKCIDDIEKDDLLSEHKVIKSSNMENDDNTIMDMINSMIDYVNPKKEETKIEEVKEEDPEEYGKSEDQDELTDAFEESEKECNDLAYVNVYTKTLTENGDITPYFTCDFNDYVTFNMMVPNPCVYIKDIEGKEGYIPLYMLYTLFSPAINQDTLRTYQSIVYTNEKGYKIYDAKFGKWNDIQAVYYCKNTMNTACFMLYVPEMTYTIYSIYNGTNYAYHITNTNECMMNIHTMYN